MKKVYEDLGPDEQLAVRDAYSSLGSYLEELADEANQLFRVDEKSTAQFEVIKIGEIAPKLPNQYWVGSAVSV